MAIYLGDKYAGINNLRVVHETEEGEWEPEIPDDRIVLTPGQYEDLQDAVNYRTGTFGTKDITRMISSLKNKYMINFTNTFDVMSQSVQQWTRPQEWPNLDSLNLEFSGNTDFIYMTFDASESDTGFSINVTGSNIVVDYGHISNSTYIIDGTANKSSTTYSKAFDGTNNYVTVRVTGTITACVFSNNTFNNRYQHALQNKLLERIAYVPNVTRLSNDTTRGNWGTYTLQREKIGNNNGTALTRLDYAYSNCLSLQDLDLSQLYTPNVTAFSYMFNNCFNLFQDLDLKHFNVAKASTFQAMFYQCRASIIDLTGWVTTALTSNGLASMFNSCYRLKHIYGLENFNTSNCTSIASIFNTCFCLQELDLSKWNTAKISNITSAFKFCRSLKNLDSISQWNISKITSLYETFRGCVNLEKLDLHNWDVSLVNNVSYAFSYCMSLKQLNIDGWYIHDVTSANYCFEFCASLSRINVDRWYINNVCTNIYYMFYACCSLQSLSLPNWDTSGLATGNYTISNIFNSCYSLKTITGISNWTLPSGNTGAIFSNCYSLETVDVSNWNTSASKNLASTFNNCYSLKSIDISNWNTSNCTSFASMFANCHNLMSLNLSNINTSNVTTFATMFVNCYSLTTIGNISNWDTKNVVNMSEMFSYCYSLKSLVFDNWDVKKITTISYMMRYCYNLETVSLKNWDLAACTTMTEMFYSDSKLHTVDMTGWKISALTTAPGALFRYCYSLKNCTGAPITLNHSYAQCYALTKESAIAIFTNLPTVTTSRTITIDNYVNSRLTSEEKAIATGKGWTIATSS